MGAITGTLVTVIIIKYPRDRVLSGGFETVYAGAKKEDRSCTGTDVGAESAS